MSLRAVSALPSLTPRRASRKPAVAALLVALALVLSLGPRLEAAAQPTPAIAATPDGVQPGEMAPAEPYPGPALHRVPAPPVQCGALAIAAFDWDTAEFAAFLLARALEDAYGCDVRLVDAAPRPTLERLRADGRAPASPDWATDGPPLLIAPGLPSDWLTMAESKGGGAFLVGAPLYGEAERRGFAVPAWFAATRTNVRTLRDAAARADLFAREGEERPVLHLCPLHWPCYESGRAVAEALGFDRKFELRAAASGAELTASLIDANINRRPWIGYYWTPSDASVERPIALLDEGDAPICADKAVREEAERCPSPFKAAPLVTAYPRALREATPEAAALIDAFAIPPDALEEAMRWRNDNGAEASEAATRFFDANPEVWRGWIRDRMGATRFGVALTLRRSEM